MYDDRIPRGNLVRVYGKGGGGRAVGLVAAGGRRLDPHWGNYLSIYRKLAHKIPTSAHLHTPLGVPRWPQWAVGSEFPRNPSELTWRAGRRPIVCDLWGGWGGPSRRPPGLYWGPSANSSSPGLRAPHLGQARLGRLGFCESPSAIAPLMGRRRPGR